MTTRDTLTGLANRFEFKQQAHQCLSEVRRRAGKFAVLYLDLDDFKAVNETLGHPVGDRLLQQVAARIQGVVRASDTVARLGGDEFAIIQRVMQVPRDAMRLAERLISVVSDPYMIDGDQIEVGASIGISLAPDDSVDADELMRAADMALYYAKTDRGSYSFFQPSMDKQVRDRRRMEQDLRLAIAERQFELHFQPIVSIAERKVTSFEALLRWNHPERGTVGAERIHSARRGDRPDRSDRRMGGARGLPAGGEMAGACQGGGQRLRGAVQVLGPGPRDYRRR